MFAYTDDTGVEKPGGHRSAGQQIARALRAGFHGQVPTPRDRMRRGPEGEAKQIGKRSSA